MPDSYDYDATYSPEDNKLRIYGPRMDDAEYQQAKACGFRFAPKQDLFFAHWSPDAADLAEVMAGEIEDEGISREERAEARAERFEGYGENRERDAKQARDGVAAIADGIPMGQPILVGHHSERHARRDQKKIENGMRRAVKMWESSKYWTSRAAGAIRDAKYKELPAVRARRIKKLGAELRKWRRATAENDRLLAAIDGELTREKALHVFGAGDCHISACFTLAEYPREAPASQYEGLMSLWSALDHNIATLEQCKTIAVRVSTKGNERRARWIAHLENRLAYETAMLDEQGEGDLLKPKARPKQPPLLNYRAPSSGIVCHNRYVRDETITYPQVEATKAEYAKVHKDHKGTAQPANGGHRLRTCMGDHLRRELDHGLVCVFLTDSKVHPTPEPVQKAPPELPPVQATDMRRSTWQAPERTEFDDMKDSLRAGVEVVTAPNLFPTPKAIAAQMVEAADLEPGHRVLEPSAGTGELMDAILASGWESQPNARLVAVEINHALVERLNRKYMGDRFQIWQGDFLEMTVDTSGFRFDRIIMNPPFEKGADIKHIERARSMLKPGGKLVALCAGGPRQAVKLQPLADTWENLPAGSFKAQGTGVNVVMMTYTRPAEVVTVPDDPRMKRQGR